MREDQHLFREGCTCKDCTDYAVWVVAMEGRIKAMVVKYLAWGDEASDVSEDTESDTA